MKTDIYIDGGGTSSKFYLVEKASKKIIACKTFKAMNIKAFENETICNLMEVLMYCQSIKRVSHIYVGIPGIKQYDSAELTQNLLKRFSFLTSTALCLMSDVELQIKLLVEEQCDNFFYISLGTGSVCYYQDREKNVAEIKGGWGHLLGDEGSAYDFAKTWIENAIVDYERHDYSSDLIKVLLEYFNISDLSQIKQIYDNQSNVKQTFAGLSKFILLECKNYRYLKDRIFSIIAKRFILWIKVIYQEEMKNCTCYLAGGLVNDAYYNNTLVNQLQTIFKRVVVSV